ncbi:MAG: virginiamycin B lyase family protein [Acidimicrobiia bacterium]
MRRIPALALLVALAACARGESDQQVRSSAAGEGSEIPGVEVPEVPDVDVPEIPEPQPQPEAEPVPTTSSTTAPPSDPPPAPRVQTCGPVTLFALGTPGGRPSGVAAGDGGSVWFTDQATSSIGRLDPDGTETRFPLPPGSQPHSIARGPDGAMWYTDAADRHRDPSAVASIGRVTPSGEVTEFDLPTQESNPMGGTGAGSAPAGITAGPDGAMWFAEAMADQVGRITPDGVITEFPLPRRDRMHANPVGITAGPDGAVWFGEPLFGMLARIDVHTHAITEFELPHHDNGLVGANTLTSGPDGALWYEDPGGSAIGRVSTSGKVRSFPLPSYRWPWALTAGPDGNLWFLETSVGRLVRMTPEGAFTDWAAPAEAAGIGVGSSTQIAFASDGAVWFAAPSGNRVGRVACTG